METKTQAETEETEWGPESLMADLPPIHKKAFELADGSRFRSESSGVLSRLVQRVDGFLATGIDTPERYLEADELGKQLKNFIKAADARMEEILSPLRQAKQAADGLKRDLTNPPQLALDKLGNAVTKYRLEVERKRKEEEERRIAEQRRREEQARKEQQEREAEERRRQEEYEREQREYKAKMEKEAAERRQREEDARLSRAAVAEQEGDPERALSLLEEPTAQEAPAPLPPPPPKPAPVVAPMAIAAPLPEPVTAALPDTGSKLVKRWTAQIIDPYAVLATILEDRNKPEDQQRVTLEAIEFNMPWFNKRARDLKGLMVNLIPGAVATPEAKTNF